MNHGSLFSGIGGFDLAASWMGWTNIFHCEWNPFCQKVLKHYWPESISYDDICKTDFTIHRGQIDILTGGFPCQPYSVAGKRKGTEDSRHLWPEMLRAIRECRPTWIIGENVPGIISWSEGLVFEQVCTELENEGYEVQPIILPACGVNAPHKRERIWIIANTYENGTMVQRGNRNSDNQKRHSAEKIQEWQNEFIGIEQSDAKTAINSQRIGQPGPGRTKGSICPTAVGNWKASWTNANGGWPTQSPIRGGNDGLSNKLHKQCLEAYGNAIVPQVAYQIFKVIEQINICTTSKSKTEDR